MSGNSHQQLLRVLSLFPLLTRKEGLSTAHLRELLEADSEKDVIKAFTRMLHIDRADSLFAEQIQVNISSDNVSVFYSHFRRPMRLTYPELQALDLGLSILKSERAPGDHGTIERAQARLRETLVNIPPSQAKSASAKMHVKMARSEPVSTARPAASTTTSAGASVSGSAGAQDGDGVRSGNDPANSVRILPTLETAQKNSCKVRIVYQSRNGESKRKVAPYVIIYSNGYWYLIGYCEEKRMERTFRVDRIWSVELTDEHYNLPADFCLDELTRNSRVLRGEPQLLMKVRYSPVIARWIAEREGRDLEEDGSLIVTHPVHDMGWAVSHVLQYGPEAEVLSPPEVRSLVVETLRAMWH